MVASTIRDAVSNVAATFRANDRESPFHYEGGVAGADRLRKELKEILAAFENKDPPPERQKAVTPTLLEDMLALAGMLSPVHEHTADLAVGGFFFAMRACEFCRTEKKGRTKTIEMCDITFRDKSKRVVPKTSHDLEKRAHYVTIRFVFQKNKERTDRRTQGRSRRYLCPVRAWARVCRRVITTCKKVNASTQVCQLGDSKGRITHVTSSRVRDLLRLTCNRFSKEKGYGIDEHELGTRSIRSGAAMALFLQDHSVEKIKILGRWSSDAFLVYIRPQVLEWTNIMARDMASNKDFRDLNRDSSRSHRSVKRHEGTMPSFHMSH